MASRALYCSFCAKAQGEVRKLIAGPTVFICNECVDLCHGIVHEDEAPSPPPDARAEAMRLATRLMEMGNVTTQVALALHEFHRAMRQSQPAGPGELIGFGQKGDHDVPSEGT